MQGRVDGIWWRASGHGRPLLLIQGVGYPAAMWYRILPALEPHMRVIAFDNRGIANSAGANGLANLTIGRMASDAASVIQDAADGPVDVLGVSLGGIVAQELALAHPSLIRRLVLIGTHTADSRVVVADAEVIAMMQQRPSLDDEAALRSSVPYVYAPGTPERLIEEDLAVRRAAHVGWDGFKAQMRASVRYSGTSSRLPRVHTPTLILHGDADRLVPPGNAHVIHDRLPKSEIRLLEGLSHNCYSEDPEAVAREVVAFLTANAAELPAEREPDELAAEGAADDLLTSGAVPGIQPVGEMPFPTSAISLPELAESQDA